MSKIPGRPVAGLADPNQVRRDRETLNRILDHSFDDSRVQTIAETLAGVTPINPAFPPFDVRRYGARLDGVTDDTAPFTRAMLVASTAGGGTITFGGNTVVTQLSLLNKVSVQGIGNPTMTLSASSSSDVALSGIGTLGASQSLTSNAAQGTKVLAVASVTSFPAGTRLLIRESTYVSGAIGRKQQINKVASSSGTTINLTNPLFESYTTAASAEILVLNAIGDFQLEGFQIIVPGSQGGCVNLQYCANYTLRDMSLIGAYTAASFKSTTTAFGAIFDCEIRDTQGGGAGSSNGLGLYVVEATHDLIISRNLFSNYTENAIETRSRFIEFTDNTCLNALDTAINTHGSGASEVLIADNLIDGTGSHGIAIGFSSHAKGDSRMTVRGNKIRNTAKHGISVAGASGLENDQIVIESNDISAFYLSGADNNVGIFVSYAFDTQLINNRIYGLTIGNDPPACISLLNSTRCRVAGNRCRDIANGYGIQVDNSLNYTISDNFFAVISSHNIITSSSTGTNRIVNNWADDTTRSIEVSVYESGNTWNSGTVTLTLTGMTGTVNVDYIYERIGWTVTIYTAGGSGTSNTAAMTATGWPAALTPTSQQRVRAQGVTDNSVNKLGRVTVETSGVFTYATDFDGAAFTAANTKGVSRSTFAITLF